MTHPEIRQRLQFLLPPRLTDGEWAAITSQVADFVREEVLRVLPEKANHEKRRKNTTHEKDEYWGCCECYEDTNFNLCRSQILTKLKKRDEV